MYNKNNTKYKYFTAKGKKTIPVKPYGRFKQLFKIDSEGFVCVDLLTIDNITFTFWSTESQFPDISYDGPGTFSDKNKIKIYSSCIDLNAYYFIFCAFMFYNCKLKDSWRSIISYA